MVYSYNWPRKISYKGMEYNFFDHFSIGKCQLLQQAGTGPSRRHIQGSKIAKRLPSVKYSFTVLENRKFFENFFLKKLHTKKMDRVARRGSLAREKKSHNAEKTERGTL